MRDLVQLRVDPDRCVGYGECLAVDPGVVELDDAGCARLLVRLIDPDRARTLCDACPACALELLPADV